MPKNVSWAQLRTRLQEQIDERNVSVRQAAREIGITHGALNRMLSGETNAPYERTQRQIAAWVEAPPENYPDVDSTDELDAPSDGADQGLVETLVIDPNTARRLLGVVGPEDTKTRIAIMRELEDVLLETGTLPPAWPKWFTALRREVYGKEG